VRRNDNKCFALRPADRLLVQGHEPIAGTHVVTPRRGYTHHGIYVGDGKVVQYGGLALGLRTGPVEEVPLMEFTRGYPLWMRPGESPCFNRQEIVRRARSRIGENRYHLLRNNCEHFCEWCLRGQPRSYQVDELLARPRWLLRSTIGLMAKLFNVRPLRVAVVNHSHAAIGRG